MIFNWSVGLLNSFVFISLSSQLPVCKGAAAYQLGNTGTSGAIGCLDHRFRASPAYTARLLALHQHRANNKCRDAARNQSSESTSATQPEEAKDQLNPFIIQCLIQVYQINKYSIGVQRLINLEIPVLVQSLKSSNVELG